MPAYLVELEDGRKFRVDSDTPLTTEEATQHALGQLEAPEEPVGSKQGRLSSFASNVGRGAASIVPGVIGGTGYLVGSDTLTQGAKNIEKSIEGALPVNPAYQDEFTQKVGNVLGQAGTMLATGGAAGALGKGLAAARGLEAASAAAKGTQLAGRAMLGSGMLQGTYGGGQEAEKYGMEGGAAYARALLGGALEGATEKYLFGMGTELAPVKKYLGDTLEKGIGGIAKAVGTEAGEEATSELGGNLATTALAPEGVQTPSAFTGVGEAALLGGVAGGFLGGVNTLMGGTEPSPEAPTIEGSAMVDFNPQTPEEVEAKRLHQELMADLGAGAVQPPSTSTRVGAKPTVMGGRGAAEVQVNPIERIQQSVDRVAAATVAANAELLPATAAVLAQSAQERAAMEQKLSEAQDEGILADIFSEERARAAQREDAVMRQRGVTPVAETPIAETPVAETPVAETRLPKKPKTKPLSLSPAEQLRSEGKVGFPMPISAGGGWFSTADWRKSFDTEITDLWNKVDLLRAVANNRGVKATDQDLVDALELGQTLLSEDAPDLTNLGSDIARNPAASDATKAAALAFREKAFERLSENLVAETPVAETPPQDQTIFRSVENVVAPVPEAGVETGMAKLTSDFDTLFELPAKQPRTLTSMRDRVIAKMDELESTPALPIYGSISSEEKDRNFKKNELRDAQLKKLNFILEKIEAEKLMQSKGQAPFVRPAKRKPATPWSQDRPTVEEAKAYLTEKFGPEEDSKYGDAWDSVRVDVNNGIPRNRSLVNTAIEEKQLEEDNKAADEKQAKEIAEQEEDKVLPSLPAYTPPQAQPTPSAPKPSVETVAEKEVEDKIMDVPQTMQYLYGLNLSKTDREKAKKLLEKTDKEARKAGNRQGGRAFYVSDVTAAVEEVLAQKQDSADFRKKLAAAKTNRKFSQELDALVSALEVEEAQLQSIQSDRGMFGAQWAERNVRARATSQKKKIRDLKDRIVSLSPSKIALQSQKPTPTTNANEIEKANRTPAVEGKPSEQGTNIQAAEGTAQREGEGAEVTTQRDTSKPEQMTPEERGQLGHQEVIELAKQDYELAKTGQTWGYSGGQNYKSKAAAVKDTKARLDKVSTPTESDIKRGASDHYGEVNKALADQKPVSKAAVDAYGITLPEGYVADGELYAYRPEGAEPSTVITEPPTFGKGKTPKGYVRQGDLYVYSPEAPSIPAQTSPIPSETLPMYTVYPYGKMFAVMLNDKGDNFGNSLFDTREEADAFAENQKRIDEANALSRERDKVTAQKVAEAQAEKDKLLNDYLDDLNLTAMQRGKLKKTLQESTARRSTEKNKDYTGPREKVIREMVDDGYSPKTEEVPAIKEPKRNLMDNRQQAEFDRKRKAAGNKTEYSLETESGARFIVTKAEHDYAKWLSSQATPAPAEPKPSAETVAETPALPPIERDTSKPEQMSFPQWFNQGKWQTEIRRTPPEVSAPTPNKSVKILTPTLDGVKEVKGKTYWLPGYKGPNLVVSTTKIRGKEHYWVRFEAGGFLLENGQGGDGGVNDVIKTAIQRINNWTKQTGKTVWELAYASELGLAMAARKPVLAEAIDTYYQGKTPKGYVRQGDLYVYSPETTPTPTTPDANKIEKTSRTPAVQSQPIVKAPAVQTEEGTAQREGEGAEVTTQRDTSKPEQMTPEKGDEAFVKGGDARITRRIDNIFTAEGKQMVLLQGLRDPLPLENITVDPKSEYRRRKQKKAEQGAQAVKATPELIRQLGDIAVKNKQHVDQGYIDAIGGRVPEGYVAEGELYVYRPEGAEPSPVITEPPAFGEGNKMFPREKAEAAGKRMRKSLGQTNMGLDPQWFMDALQFAGFYIEGGARSFADFSAKMIAQFGEAIRPYLKQMYNGVRDQPGFDATGMDSAAYVEAQVNPKEEKLPEEKPIKEAPVLEELKPSEGGPAGITEALIDEQRKALGLPEIDRMLKEVYGREAQWAEALAAVAIDPTIGSRLVNELNTRPRVISTLETNILVHEHAVRRNALDKAIAVFNAATPEQKESARQQLSNAVADYTALNDAVAFGGSEKGRALEAHKRLINMDFTLASMVSKATASNEGELSEDQMSAITNLHKQIADLQEKLASAKAQTQAISEERLNELLSKAKDEGFREGRNAAEVDVVTKKALAEAKKAVAKAKGDKPSFWKAAKAAAEERIANRRGKLYNDVFMLNAVATTADHVIIAAATIAEGITNFVDWVAAMKIAVPDLPDSQMQEVYDEGKALVDAEASGTLDFDAEEATAETAKKRAKKAPAIERVAANAAEGQELSYRVVYDLVKEKLVEGFVGLKAIEAATADLQEHYPEITEREVRDMFSQYGQVKEPSQEDLAKQLAELRRIAQLSSAIEDVKNLEHPKRTGLQRDKATQTVRAYQRALNVAMKENRALMEDMHGARELASPLDAIKSRLKNQIADLQSMIDKKAREPKRPGVDYDQEARDLRDIRDKLVEELDRLVPKKTPTLEERVRAEKYKLDRRILELEKAIKTKDVAVRKTEPLYTQELTVMRDQRDALNAELRQLREDILGKPERTQEQVNADAIKQFEDSIAELERRIKEKDVTTKEGLKPEETPEYLALKAKKEALQATFKKLKEDILGKSEMSPEKRIELAEKAIAKSITKLNANIAAGGVAPVKRVSKTPETDFLAEQRKIRDGLKKTHDALLKAKRDAARDPMAEKLKSNKARYQKKIEELSRRIREQDFSKPVRKPKVSDKETIAMELKIEELQEQFAKMLFDLELSKRGMGKKLLDTGGQILNTARAILTSVDVSAVLRQGGFIALGNPLRGFKSIGPMFKAFASKEAEGFERKALERRDNYGLYKRSKLFLADTNKVNQLTKQEENFMSRWLDKIPWYLGGGVVRGSQRAYNVFLNRLRADTFDAMLGNLKKGREPTQEEADSVADYINIATGRGNLGKMTQAATALNTVFFAPRLVASRFQLLLGYPYFKANDRTKNLILREYAKFLTGVAVVYALGMLAQDDDDKPLEVDPRSSDFLKLRFGNTRIDPMTGLLQSTVLIARLASGEKKTAKGKLVPIRGDKVPYGSDSSGDVIFNFARSKFSPAIGSVFNILEGKNVVGEKTDILEESKRMVVPMSFSEAADTLEEQGIPKGTALTILMLFGMGVQTYDSKKK